MNTAVVITVCQALREELSWINDRYDEVQFKHSDFNKEVIAIAEVDGIKAGLGRLVTIDDRTLELGGMYVFNHYRGCGVAGKIIKFLLQHVKDNQQVFCIPFMALEPLYRKYGFVQVFNRDTIPKFILEKQNWCDQTYEQKTLVLVLKH
ncbi:GNAT family N-acetyltransferase [Phormidium tenue FACHB-886]|nr:GNAT family N-acetyltransferase [Phormidium tenue FACHB-886]